MASRHALPNRRRLLAITAAVLALSGGVATELDQASSAAAATTVKRAASQNWAGYVATGRTFSSVSGTWVVPTAKRSTDGYSAAWIGLGGASSSSQALEQVGTDSDSSGGRTSYYAWYELVPAASKRLSLKVHPGDTMSARVSVSDSTVTIRLSDRTTGGSVTKTLHMARPDTSSAEWIVEAPSAEMGDGQTTQLPLADFGKVSFTGASATAAGHTGAITDPAWMTTRIRLATAGQGAVAGGPGGFRGGPAAAVASPTEASPSALGNSATSFTVSLKSASASASQATDGSYGAAPGYDPGDGYAHVPPAW